MRLKRLELENFRPFYGRQDLQLETDEEHSVILIRAMNDVGKTSLFKAINFCLYGEKNSKDIPKNVNRLASSKGDGIMSVYMMFSHDGAQYEIKRSVEFEKTDSLDDKPNIGRIRFELKKNGVPQEFKKNDDEEKYVEYILPQAASQFFFFDGEKIQGYTKDPPEPNVTSAIEMVLGIKELLNARDDLHALVKEFGKELDKSQEEHSEDKVEATELIKLNSENQGMIDKIAQYERKIIAAKEVMDDCEQKLATYASLQEPLLRRETITRKINECNEALETIQLKQRQFNGNLATLMMIPLLEILHQDTPNFNTHHEWEHKTAIDVLKREICICGKKIDEEAKRNLQDLSIPQQHTDLQTIQDITQSILIKHGVRSLETSMIQLIEEKKQYQSELLSSNEQLETIEKELGRNAEQVGFDAKQISQTMTRAKDDKDSYESERDELKGQLSVKEGEYATRQKKLSAKTTHKDVQIRTKRLERCVAAHDAINNVIKDLVDSRRSEVEKLASEIFMEITNAPEVYKGIKINERYELQIITRGDVTMSAWDLGPSAGASQVIATSFIAALNRFTAREAPVIIDTPLARLDPVHREKVVQYYPKIGPQVIILYQPAELEDKYIDMIKHSIASEWLLERDFTEPLKTHISRGR